MEKRPMTRRTLQEIAEMKEVKAITIFDRDGFFVEGESNCEIDCDAICANLANECGSSHSIMTELGFGTMNQMIIECDKGKLVLVRYDDLIVAILTNKHAMLGLVKFCADSVVDKLRNENYGYC